MKNPICDRIVDKGDAILSSCKTWQHYNCSFEYTQVARKMMEHLLKIGTIDDLDAYYISSSLRDIANYAHRGRMRLR